MKLKYFLVIAICFFAMFVMNSKSTDAAETTPRSYGSYVSQEGISFISYSEKWDSKKLKELSQALLKNKHGEEIKLLKKVLVYHYGVSDEKGVTGQYNPNDHSISLALGVIRTTVADMERTLAHEYGHHFTMYYLTKRQTELKYKNSWSEWGEMRNLDLYPTEWRYNGVGESNYEWRVEELVVSDYMMFYASPAARTDRIRSGYTIRDWTEPSNKNIPYGDAVPGLREYWEKISGVKSTVRKLEMPKLQSFQIEEVMYVSVDQRNNTMYNYTFNFSGGDPNLRYAYNNSNVIQCPPSRECDELNFFVLDKDEINKDGIFSIKTNHYNFFSDPFIRIYAFDPDTGGYVASPRYQFLSDGPAILKPVPYNLNQGAWMEENRYDIKKYKMISIFVNDVLQSYNTQPQIINSTTYIPFRELFASLGAVVKWDPVNSRVEANLNNISLSFSPNSKEVILNGEVKSFAHKPMLSNGITMVPLKFVSEALGAVVTWKGDMRSIYINI